MAYVKNPLDEEQQNGAGIVSTTQESGVMGGGAGVGNNKAQINQGWVNLDTYLNANKGQGEGIANAVTSSAGTAIQSAAGELNKFEQKAANTDKSQTQGLKSTQSQIVSDPAKVDVGAVKAQMAQGYKGPTQVSALDGWGDAYKAWGAANDQYAAVKDDSPAGRQAAVTRTFKPQAQNGYTQGMGTLDSFILGGDEKGKQAINSFVDSNKGITDGWKQTSGRVQSSLDAAKSEYDAARAGIQKSADDQYAAWLAKATATKGAGYERDWQAAANEVDAKFNAAGVKPVQDLNAWVTANNNYSWQDSIDDATLQALNNLAQIDSRDDTGSVQRGNNKAVNVDWAAIDRYLSDEKARQAAAAAPVVTTEAVSAQQSGTGKTGEKVTTTYADGSYDVMGPAGEIIQYNADGTIKATKGTNIFT